MLLRFMTASLLCCLLVCSTADAQQKKKNKKPAANRARQTRFKLPETVKVSRDIVYAKYGEREVKLDLYLPKNPERTPLPCIVVIHGGGWSKGDKQRFAHIAARMADNGFAAACIGYRLLPKVKFPAPVVDCKASVRWVRANAKKYGIDPDRIGAIGGSAGAHLAAMLATSHKVSQLEGEAGNQSVSSRVQAAVGMATPADMSRFGSRRNLSKELAALISPITHVDKDSAPILLIHSKADKTVPYAQSLQLQKKYKAAGVRVELVTYVKQRPA